MTIWGLRDGGREVEWRRDIIRVGRSRLATGMVPPGEARLPAAGRRRRLVRGDYGTGLTGRFARLCATGPGSTDLRTLRGSLPQRPSVPGRRMGRLQRVRGTNRRWFPRLPPIGTALPRMMAEVRQGRGPFFGIVPMALGKKEWSDCYHVAVYFALRATADFGEAGESVSGCVDSMANLADLAGCGTTTFRDRANDLRKRGWIDWASGRGEGTRNEYVVHFSPTINGEGSPRDGEGSPRDGEGGRRETGTLPTENHSTENQNRKARAENGDLFDDGDDVSAIRDVWGHYCTRYAELHSESRADRMTLDACDRRSKIRARFREGYTPKDLKRAIDGCFYDDWHRARSKVELEYILRNQSKVEDFITRFEERESDRSSGGATDHPKPDELGWGDEK